LATLENGTRFWIKDDAGCSAIYGGNKVRKFEFLLGSAQQRGQKKLIVHGDVESHTVQACGLLGRQAGFQVQAVVFPYRNQSFETPELDRLTAAGVRIHRRGSMLATVLYAHWLGWRTGAWVVPLGASTAVATLGHVSAALELLEQLRQERRGQPKRIYIPFATGGSVAGLLIGLALGGGATQVVAVQTVERIIANRRRLCQLVRATLALLGRGGDAYERCMEHLEMIDGRYLGSGYRDVPKPTESAIAVAARQDLQLEPAFSGKAFAALLDALPEYPHGELLFWNTHACRNRSEGNCCFK
jgi:D-cysteine desulfhydrase